MVADSPVRKQRLTQEIITFVDLGKALTGTLDRKEVIRRVMEKVRELLKPRAWSLLLRDETSGELDFAVAEGEVGSALAGQRLSPGKGIAGWVAENKEAVVIEDVSGDPRFDPEFDRALGFKTRSILAVPIAYKDIVFGVIELIRGRDDESGFSKREAAMLRAVADFAAVALENARNHNKVRDLAIRDDCTGLHNARFLHKVLEQETARSRRHHTPVSIIFFDLDRFKLVNDKHGHLCGSSLLAEVGELLLGQLRKEDSAVRYGGDEFVALLPHTIHEQAMNVARRIWTAVRMNKFLQSMGLEIHQSASYGVASMPDHASTAEELLKLADDAMYMVKRKGRDGVASASELEPGEDDPERQRFFTEPPSGTGGGLERL
ncbi:MAG: sensor domain-containing diguanylate cyclase [Deltaproteobacteria bacterium]|nr:sensor domain-containing diguanylate cyclase [Deltaproteobacteria bacterium]